MSEQINHDHETYSLDYFSQKRMDMLGKFNDFVAQFNGIYSSYQNDDFINDNQFSKLQEIAEGVYQIYEKGQKLCLRSYFFDEFESGNITEQLWCEISDTLHKAKDGTTDAYNHLKITGTENFDIGMLNDAMARFCDPQIEVKEAGNRIGSLRSTAPQILSSSQINVNSIRRYAPLHNSNKHDYIESNRYDYIDGLFVAITEIGHFVDFFLSDGNTVWYPHKDSEVDHTELMSILSENDSYSTFRTVKILITDRVSLNERQLLELARIHWDIVIDFDPRSHIDGLELGFSEKMASQPTILYTNDIFVPEPISELYWFRCYNRDSEALPTEREMKGRHIGELIRSFEKFRTKVTGKILVVTNTSSTSNEYAKMITKDICDIIYPTDKYMVDFPDTEKKSFRCFSLNGNSCFTDNDELFRDRKTQFFCVAISLPLLLDQMASSSPESGAQSNSVYIDDGSMTKQLDDCTYHCLEIIYAQSEIAQEKSDNPSYTEPKEFYLAKVPISWYLINSNNTAVDSNLKSIFAGISKEEAGLKGPNYVIPYDPGVGGTTALRIIAFRFSRKMPSVLLKQYTSDTWKECKKLSKDTDSPIFIGVDENDISYEDYVKFCQELEHNFVKHLCLFLYRNDRKDISSRDTVNKLQELVPLTGSDAGILRTRLVRIIEKDTVLSEIERKKRIETLNGYQDPSNRYYPFIMCMYAFDKDFEGVPEYIRRFLDGKKYNLTAIQKDILIWLSIVTFYSKVSLDVELFSASPELFTGSAALVSEKLLRFEQNDLTKSRTVKVIHISFAEEILSQTLSDGHSFSYFNNICQKLIDFVKYVANNGTACSVDVKQNIMKNLFIDKEPFDFERSTSKMSPLLDNLYNGAMFASVDKSVKVKRLKDIFQVLVDNYPENAHFHAHYGRFLAYVVSALDGAELDTAIKEAKMAVSLSDSKDCVIYHILANCQRQKIRHLINKYQRSQVDPAYSLDDLDELENAILDLAEEAEDNYELSRRNGEAPGYICDIDMCIDLVDFCRKRYEIDYTGIVTSSSDEDENMKYYRWYYENALTLYDELDEIEHITERDTLRVNLGNLKQKTMDLKGQLKDTVDYWKTYLSNSYLSKRDRELASRLCITSKYSNGGFDTVDRIEDLQYMVDLSKGILNEEVKIGDLARWFALNLRLSVVTEEENDSLRLEDMFSCLSGWQEMTKPDSNEGKYLQMYLLIVSSIQALNGSERGRRFVQNLHLDNERRAPMYYLKNIGKTKPTLGSVVRFNKLNANNDYLEINGVIARKGIDSYQVEANGVSAYFGMDRQDSVTRLDVNKNAAFGLLYTLDGARVIINTLRLKTGNTDHTSLGCGSKLICTLIGEYKGGWIVSFNDYSEEYGYLDKEKTQNYSKNTKLSIKVKLELVIVEDKKNGPEVKIPPTNRKKKCWKMA